MLSVMNEQLEFIRLITERLGTAGIPYMLTGSIAMTAYARPRMTRDIDLVIEAGPADGDAIVDSFKGDCYIDANAAREAITSHGMFNVIHNKWLVKADFIVRKDGSYRKMEFDRRRFLEIDGFRVWVVTPEDLVLSKLVWLKDSGSSQQREDVQTLIETVETLDRDYLHTWATQLDVHHILRDIVPQ